MGQILNRISKVIKARSLPDESIIDAEKIIGSGDDELKRIIDELNRDPAKTASDYQPNHKTGSNQSYSFNRSSSENASSGNRKMTRQRASAILGVNAIATQDEIRSAYKSRIMEYHPDRVATLGEEIKQLAALKTVEINEAYAFLKNM